MSEQKISKDVLVKAKQTKNAEELLALAKENGMEMTAEQAEENFAKLHQNGELADDELDNVAGGCSQKVCANCKSNQLFPYGGGKFKCIDCGNIQ
ncbi:MAG: hypothetical protein ACI4HI_07765 [Lachnospiraceae bacterium]